MVVESVVVPTGLVSVAVVVVPLVVVAVFALVSLVLLFSPQITLAAVAVMELIVSMIVCLVFFGGGGGVYDVMWWSVLGNNREISKRNRPCDVIWRCSACRFLSFSALLTGCGYVYVENVMSVTSMLSDVFIPCFPFFRFACYYPVWILPWFDEEICIWYILRSCARMMRVR